MIPTTKKEISKGIAAIVDKNPVSVKLMLVIHR
jgi:hypothetical protein